MSSKTNEEELELNYVKIDSKNEIRLIGNEDYVLEAYSFITSVQQFKEENIGNTIKTFLKKTIPELEDLSKTNQDFCKPIIKIINNDKKKSLTNIINQFLTIDFKEHFIFNQTNVKYVCYILAYCLNELLKKFKTYQELKNAIKQVKLDKYDFFKIYSNKAFLKNKEKSDCPPSRPSNFGKTTSTSSNSSQGKDLDDDFSESEENPVNEVNKYHSVAKGIFYIDNNPDNIMNSSVLTDDYNYNEEEKSQKILTKDCFFYPKTNKNSITEKSELPIELILLLSKLKNVKTLIFQIHTKIDEQYLKWVVFLLLHTNIIFSKGIEEIKFDLGNEEIQQGIERLFNERTSELYIDFQKNKDLRYNFENSHARSVNCWEPEGDFFFVKSIAEENSEDMKNNYPYHIQVNKYANQLCNVYNELGNLTTIKYIKPISTNKNNNKDFHNIQKLYSVIDSNNNNDTNNLNNDVKIAERTSDKFGLSKTFNRISTNSIEGLTNNTDTNNSNNKKITPSFLFPFVNKYKSYLQMISIFSNFLSTNLKKIRQLSLYFHTSYAYEISVLNKLMVGNENCHFLIFLNKIETLTEADFSFNSLDDKSFEYILGIINSNSNLSSLKISFFSNDTAYFDNSLFNLCASKKISLSNLFQEFRQLLIENVQDKEKKMNYTSNLF